MSVAHRRPPLHVDHLQSLHLRRQIAAREGYCYTNAAKALRYVREGSCVIGWVVYGRSLTEHAWIETADGALLEVTPGWRIPARQYFAAKRYSLRELHRMQPPWVSRLQRGRSHARALHDALAVLLGPSARTAPYMRPDFLLSFVQLWGWVMKDAKADDFLVTLGRFLFQLEFFALP